jgi:hypothetical protein
MFEELKGLASGSEWIFPSRGSLKKPIAHSTLNVAVRALEFDVRDFVIHDFRRTASTHLHEAGFQLGLDREGLAHETKGIRGVYNRAQYADQRREMLQWWADFVDSQIEEGRQGDHWPLRQGISGGMTVWLRLARRGENREPLIGWRGFLIQKRV